ncbi:hypothetical protein IMY05_004G0049400 [Salix suchowensis]|nr:hypothetical protein IMY05_004G0049400 [Salix suchowensis]
MQTAITRKSGGLATPIQKTFSHMLICNYRLYISLCKQTAQKDKVIIFYKHTRKERKRPSYHQSFLLQW